MKKGLSFSKFLHHVKFECYLNCSDFGQDVQSLWTSSQYYYGYFESSGLRIITNELFCRLLKYKI